MLDFSEIAAISALRTSKVVTLSPESVTILLSIAEAQIRFDWENNGASLTDAEWDTANKWIAQAEYEVMTNVLSGTISAFATVLPPMGSLECDGASYLRVDYPELYAVLDAAFIIDADNFAVPDLRGRTVIGVGTGSGLTPRAMNDTGGEETHTLTTAEMPSHSHGVTDPSHAHTEGNALPALSAAIVGVPIPSAVPGLGVTGAALTGISIQSTGGDGAHENMQPFMALRYAIWT